MNIKCKHHGEQKAIINGYYKDKVKYRCALCTKAQISKHRHDYKTKLVEYAGGKCNLCGYSKYNGALQFHHKDPAEKDFVLSKGKMGKSWDDLVKEVDKCVLLCANCHAEVHAGIAKLP